MCETPLRTMFRVSDSQLIMLTLNSSTFFVADMVIPFGRYSLFVWPMWSWPIWFVADIVVADMVCGRYGTDPVLTLYIPFIILYVSIKSPLILLV